MITEKAPYLLEILQLFMSFSWLSQVMEKLVKLFY